MKILEFKLQLFINKFRRERRLLLNAKASPSAASSLILIPLRFNVTRFLKNLNDRDACTFVSACLYNLKTNQLPLRAA